MSYFATLQVNMHHFRAKVSKGLLGSDGAHGAGKWKFLSRINETEISFRLKKLFKTIWLTQLYNPKYGSFIHHKGLNINCDDAENTLKTRSISMSMNTLPFLLLLSNYTPRRVQITPKMSTNITRYLYSRGAYHLARKSGNFGLKSNGKVIFRKFHSEIVSRVPS